MKLFNFGIPEVILILVVMIIFLGPEQIVDLAGRLGRTIRRITHSEIWTSIWQTSRDIRNIPKTLVDETGLEESMKDIQDTANTLKQDIGEAQNEIKSAQTIHPEPELDGAKAALRDAGYIQKPEQDATLPPQPASPPTTPKEVPTLVKKKEKS
ncbi:MAG: twin-arginine translocase TatA/TatE family subunit [Anaerolineae bacterium]|nr:twin-arginine translocase TatA/TatE family subunit [Anaerolineae bacterium]